MIETKCSRCGAALPREGELEGVCPACLLRDALAAPEEAGAEDDQQRGLAEVQALFEDLEVLERIGRGGMGVVYKARQRRLDRLVALKILAPERTRDASFGGRFLREARALARLSHPNVVTVYDFGERGELCYLLMEYVEGQGLRERIRAGELPPEQALAIVPQICAGLQYAHERGVVHRDIKPENLLVDAEGRVKIADFGLAKLLEHGAELATITRGSQVMGTPHYMAPEQATSPLAVDHRADIYSLGVVFYELLTGELPVGVFEPPSRKARVDARFDEVVYKALEREPARRYQAARDVQSDVEHISHGDAGARLYAERAGAGGEAPPLAWLARIPADGALVAAAALIAGVVWMAVLGLQERLPGGPYWFALAYPFGFLAMRGAQRSALPGVRTAAVVAGFLVCAVSSVLTSNHDLERGGAFQLIAGAVLVSSHLVFDSSLRCATREIAAIRGLIAFALLVLASACHAASYRPGEGIAYFFGMGAIVTGTTGVLSTPDVFQPAPPRALLRAVTVAYAVAVVFALAYFSEAWRLG